MPVALVTPRRSDSLVCARVELLDEGDLLSFFDHESAHDLVARHGQVPLWMGSHVLVGPEGELNSREAMPVAAFTKKGDGRAPVKFFRLGGNVLVRVAENVLGLHFNPRLLPEPLPRSRRVRS
jgi:hypothetical protein